MLVNHLFPQVFDILPLYGTLKPGETEQITLTFYGHANIKSTAKALCEVEGGPTYEVDLQGTGLILTTNNRRVLVQFYSAVQ